MAQTVHTVITDDLGNTDLELAEATTVRWMWRGTTYEFDTSAANLAAIERDKQSVTIGRLLSVSRKVVSRASSSPTAGGRREVESKTIREWARLNGHKVPERGRIPKPIRDAYLAGT